MRECPRKVVRSGTESLQTAFRRERRAEGVFRDDLEEYLERICKII